MESSGEKIYGLLDCNSFFASCEKVFHPEWEKRPVIVLSNNDGCVVARSAEAKRWIGMGDPYFRIKKIAEANGIVVRSANFSFYGDMSRRVMETLSHWTDEIEIYSIDEAFLDLTRLFANPLYYASFTPSPLESVNWGEGGTSKPAGDGKKSRRRKKVPLNERLARLGKEMVETVPRWTGIPISLGIGPTKTLAKLANKLAKGREDHYFSLIDPADREEGLRRVELEDIWGVGRHLYPKFRRLGLFTAYDLSRVDPLYMRKNFTVVQERLVRELNGEVCYGIEQTPEPRQNIQVSRSFGEMVTELADLETAVASFAAKGAERLRRQKSVATAVGVQLATNRFRTELPQYFPGIVAGFPRPTADSTEILKTALDALRSIYRGGVAYKKASIILTGLTDEKASSSQGFLFEPDPDIPPVDRESRKRLFKTIDALNRTLGAGRIFFAAEGIDKTWRPSSEFISPSFTTRWEEIPVVKAK